MGRGWKNFFFFFFNAQKSLDCFEQTIGRIIDVTNSSSEDSEKSGNQSGENLYHPI